MWCVVIPSSQHLERLTCFSYKRAFCDFAALALVLIRVRGLRRLVLRLLLQLNSSRRRPAQKTDTHTLSASLHRDKQSHSQPHCTETCNPGAGQRSGNRILRNEPQRRILRDKPPHRILRDKPLQAKNPQSHPEIERFLAMFDQRGGLSLKILQQTPSQIHVVACLIQIRVVDCFSRFGSNQLVVYGRKTWERESERIATSVSRFFNTAQSQSSFPENTVYFDVRRNKI